MTEMQVISGTALPIGWKHIPLKHNLRRLSEKSKKGGRVVALENIESWTGRAIETESVFDGDGVDFRRGDILFGKLRPYLAKVYLAESAGEAVGDLWALRPHDHIEPRFAAYQLLEPGFIDRVNGSTTGAKMPRAEWGFVGSIKVPTPPIEEQTSIVAFLDRETGRIDGLINKKTQFIALLKEKRAAVITHAVTRGIDPDAPMKDSGQDWLGRVPAHWGVVPATALFTVSGERAREGDQMLSATQKYGVIPLAEYEALEQRQVTMAVVNLDMRKHVELGDFVISMRSMDGGLERARAVGSVRSSYAVLKPGPDVEGRFYGALMKSSLYIQALRLTSNFIRDGQDLNFSHVRKVKLPKPDLREQAAIADHIEAETARIDGLITLTERSIDLLREKRAALITAAVTGKIDVRAAA